MQLILSLSFGDSTLILFSEVPKYSLLRLSSLNILRMAGQLLLQLVRKGITRL